MILNLKVNPPSAREASDQDSTNAHPGSQVPCQGDERLCADCLDFSKESRAGDIDCNIDRKFPKRPGEYTAASRITKAPRINRSGADGLFLA